MSHEHSNIHDKNSVFVNMTEGHIIGRVLKDLSDKCPDTMCWIDPLILDFKVSFIKVWNVEIKEFAG